AENYFRINNRILEYIGRSTLTSTTIDSVRINGFGRSHFIVFNSFNPLGSPLTLLGGSSDDTLGTYGTPWNINFDGGGGYDSAEIEPSPGAKTVFIDAQSIADGVRVFNYSNLEIIDIFGDDASNNFNIAYNSTFL